MQKPTKEQIQESLKQIRYIDSHLGELPKVIQQRREDVKAALTEYLAEAKADTLKDIDIEELNRDKAGLRLSSFVNAGYKSVWDVYRASLDDIVEIDGVGEKGAAKAKEIAKTIADSIDVPSVKLTTDNKTETSEKLIKALYSLQQAENQLGSAKDLYAGTHDKVAKLIAAAEPGASGGLKWFFTGSSAKDSAINAWEQIESLLSSQYGLLGINILSAVSHAEKAAPEVYWNDFANNAAKYSAKLESIDERAVVSTEKTQGDLPKELAEEVAKVDLDLRGLKCTLRKYQIFGVQYIVNQKTVLLGDEMGLGKTVQAIAAMVHLRNQQVGNHFLVVCPASVLVNWCREIEQHSDLKAYKVHGNTVDLLQTWIWEGGVAVTTYETLSKLEIPENFMFTMMVADEAHYVKNAFTKRSVAVMKFRVQTMRVLFMTGTPIENNVEEMTRLISCLNIDVSRRIKNMKQLFRAPQYREAIAPVYFRRRREDVLTELPEKNEINEWLELGKAEKEDYKALVKTKNHMAARQLSFHVTDLNDSCKAQRLLEICEMAKDEGRKVLIFSFFTNTINRVLECLGDRCIGPINGSVPPEKRQEMVDAFTKAPEGAVLVSQIVAGGAGLNIQAASVVVFCEPQQKPSTETQALSRSYRMGQSRNVLVYRLLCEKTIEERMINILSDKQKVFDNFADVSVAGEKSLELDDKSLNILLDEEEKRLEEEEKQK